jgi:TonB family protein
MLEMSQRRSMGAPQMRYNAQTQQPRKLMFALVLLLVALVAVLVKDRQFWFGSEESTIESDMPATQPVPQAAKSAAAPAPSAPAQTTRKHIAAVPAAAQDSTEETPAVTATRTVLPPLDVEVVAGENHRAIHPPASATKIEVAKPAAIELDQPAATLAAPTNASERQVVPVSATHLPQSAFKATYPVLAQHMNVQGSVVMEAVISAEGVIESVRVLSGPAILSSAAQQAVREWRFKPIYQNGQAVESKAKITVNFTIKVGESLPSNTLAQGSPADAPIVNR